MSLINQMLKDIDKRQAGKGLSYSVDQGLRAAAGTPSRSWVLVVILAALLTAAFMTLVYWDRITGPKPAANPIPMATSLAPPPAGVVAPATPTTEPVTQPPREPVTMQSAAPSRSAAADAEKPGQVLKAPTVEQQSVNLLRKAETQVRSGQLKDAQATLEQALAVYSANQDARILLSRIQLQEGQLDSAIATLRQGLSDRGNAAEYHATLGQLLQRKEQHDDAIAQYVLALKRSPNNAQWLVGLAISLQAKGQLNAAAEAYQQALDIGTLPAGLASFADQRLRQISR